MTDHATASARRPPRALCRHCLTTVTAAMLILFFSLPGCGRFIGGKMVESPNFRRSALAVGDLTQEDMRYFGVDRQIRVKVGPPEASLSLLVVEPRDLPIRVNVGQYVGENLYWDFGPDDRPYQLGGEPLGTILVLHGIHDHNEGYNNIWGQIFAAAGYRAILVDLRGHGRSTGDYLTFGVVEARDISQVIDALEEQGLISGRLGVFGVSYGGAVAIQSAARDSRISAVTTVAAFSSLESVVPTFGERYVVNRFGNFGWSMMRGMVPDVIRSAGRTARFDPRDASPVRAIAHAKAPVLLIHGKGDVHVPYQQAEQLFNAASSHTKLVLVNRATHLSLPLRRVDQVRELSLEWFDRWLAPPMLERVRSPAVASAGNTTPVAAGAAMP